MSSYFDGELHNINYQSNAQRLSSLYPYLAENLKWLNRFTKITFAQEGSVLKAPNSFNMLHLVKNYCLALEGNSSHIFLSTLYTNPYDYKVLKYKAEGVINGYKFSYTITGEGQTPYKNFVYIKDLDFDEVSTFFNLDELVELLLDVDSMYLQDPLVIRLKDLFNNG